MDDEMRARYVSQLLTLHSNYPTRYDRGEDLTKFTSQQRANNFKFFYSKEDVKDEKVRKLEFSDLA